MDNRDLLVASTNAKIDLSRIYRLRLAPDADVLSVVQELNASPAVVYAEPDYLAHIIATPNDPLYIGQWGLSQINAPAAWDVTIGTTDTVIAVIDSGLDTSHPDLADQLWTNPGETAGNSVDDDNNGYVDDIHGWNLVDDNADLSDNTGHGTQVAGVIAAATNNGQGVAGVCWNCRLMVVKVTQSGGYANYSDIAAGVNYAAQKGVEVINLSLGGYSDSATLRAAIEAASQTAVVVGGAGNDNKSDPFYPAAYGDDVLAVAGTTITDTKIGTSNYGTWVDVSAPGELVSTTFDGGGYGSTSGTSMAAPFAAGLAGLLRSQHPSWSANQAQAHIAQTTDAIDSLNPGYVGKLGNGRIDAGQAVATASQPLLTYESHAVDGELDGQPEPGSTVDLDVTLYNEWAEASNVQATLNTSDPYVTIITGTASYGGIAAYGSGTNATSFRFSVSDSAPYAHDISFTLNVTADGGYATVAPFTVTTPSGVEYVSGVISVNKTWMSDRIYIVNGNILVQSGVTLTIQAGTVIKFDTDKSLGINGTLVAVGQRGNEIRFTSNAVLPVHSDWSGIHFTDSSVDATYDSNGDYLSGSTVQYAIIEYADEGIGSPDGGPYVSECYIVHNYIGVQGGSAYVLRHNRISNNDAGIWGDLREVSQNLIANNETGVGISSAQVVSNTIFGNINNGIDIWITTSFSHNNVLNNKPYDVRVSAPGGTLAMTDTYWGTTNNGEIDAHIYDLLDDPSLGWLDYTPFLSIPEPTAPAFLWQLALSPASPVGIQTVTFDLTFSRPMDQSVDPTVAFGTTEPYETYQVVDNAQWLDDSNWRATYDVTSLVPRGEHIISVSGARGMDGMEIPTDTRFGFTVDYAGEITDQTPPDPPWVIAGGVEGDASTVEAMWSASDPDSTINGYRYAIGSAPGAIDIVNWTATSGNSITRSGLGLVEGQQYWLVVQARNVGGLWSASGYSAFVAGQPIHWVFLPLVLRNQ